MHLLVLQHEPAEHPGIFRRFLAEDGHGWDAVDLGAGAALPGLDGYDGLWVMGGPMDVWDEDRHPWLVPEKALIREAVEDRGLPFLGFCLGHQLLAEVLGGEVAKAAQGETGVMEVQLTEAGATGVLFDGLPERFETFQWHGAEVRRLPPGAQVLATSPGCAVQAMKWGTRAYSLQFHAEIEADTLRTWAALPGAAAALEKAAGPDAVARLDADCARHMPAFHSRAERLYINWLQATATA